MPLFRNRCGRAGLAVLLSACGLWLGQGTVLPARGWAESAPADLPSGPVAQYRQLVNDLASTQMDGRGAGTRGLDLARDYLVEQFRRAGLKPGFDGSFTQPVPIRLGVDVERQELAVLDSRGRATHEAKGGTDCVAVGLSANGSFEGAAVFVGYGIVESKRGYNSYLGLDKDALRGKVAVAFRYEPQDGQGKSLWAKAPGPSGPWSPSAGLVNKAARAGEHGAVALLVVNPPSQDADKTLRPADQTASGGRANIPVMHISSELFGRMLRQAGRTDPDGEVLKLQEKSDGLKPAERTAEDLSGLVLRGRVSLKPRQGTIHNVAAVLPGIGRLADQAVVVGAHYDHVGIGRRPGATQPVVYPGADDNASGTAGVVMLARWLVERASTQPADSAAGRRTLLFVAFTGEERGLIGSRYFIEHTGELGWPADAAPSGRARRIVAMLNLDMIGRLRNNRLYVQGVDSGDRWRGMVESAARTGPLNVRMGGGGFGPSDLSSFYARKIPVLFFITGGHADVHQPTDTPDKINAPGAVEVIRVVQGVIETLKTDPAGVAYLPPKVPTTAPAVAGRGAAFLGIMPDPTIDGGEDGCPVMEVLADSPADAAGLKGGDVIVRWNDTAIMDAGGLLAAVAAGKAGDTVNLAVRRGQTVLEIPVRLGQR